MLLQYLEESFFTTFYHREIYILDFLYSFRPQIISRNSYTTLF